MSKRWRVWMVVLALGGLALPAWAQVYTWTDAQGRRHYADAITAPSNAKPVKMRVSNPAPGTTDTPSQASAPSSADATPPPASEATQSEAQACQVAQRNRQLLADPGKDVLSEDGKTVLNKEARAQRLALADKRVEAYCNVLAGQGDTP